MPEPSPAPSPLSLRAEVSGAFKPPATPEVTLVNSHSSTAIRDWDLPFFQQPRGTWRLQGPAGSGLSTALIDFVATQILQGTPAREILVITASKQAAGRFRSAVADRLAHAGHSDYVADATMVRSIHSLAFALLRHSTDQDIRLITGAEQDSVIRELLLGQLDAGPAALAIWPPAYREAVGFLGFARDLRDFLLRAAERDLSPEKLQALGQQYGQAIWTSAGAFLDEYEQVMSLGSPHNYSASELVAKVPRESLEQHPWSIIVVEDAQHLDPRSAELIQTLMAQADSAIIAGDPEQSVFSFRGASALWLSNLPVPPSHDLVLEASHRNPARQKVLCSNLAREHTFIANTLRRAHLIHDTPWQDMAVIVREAGAIAPIRRALLAAGVPAAVDATDVVLSEEHIVVAMLLALEALDTKLMLSDVEALVQGPIGGADAITMRRLLRGLRRAEMGAGGSRRAIEMLAQLLQPQCYPDNEDLHWATAYLGPREVEILERIQAVLHAGAQAEGVEQTLWAIWEATGLGEHLMAQSLRGGAIGAQADRDLDAMLALFDAAGDWVERRPQGSVRGFVRHIQEQTLPTGVRDRRIEAPKAVQILTAHGAVGQQWDLVVVAGIQEGTWPALEQSDTIFKQAALMDLIDRGIEPGLPTSRLKEQLDEEGRLFHLACTRASKQLICTAVEDPDAANGEPSQFFESFDAPLLHHQPMLQAEGAHDHAGEGAALARNNRLLSVPGLVAELRRVLGSPDASQRQRQQAARQLARLAQAGVPGAHPGHWWGIGGGSSKSPLEVHTLSPSTLETALLCPLKAQLGNVDGNSAALQTGTLVHAYAEAVSTGADPVQARELIAQAHAAQLEGPDWARESSEATFNQMLDRLDAWLEVHNAGDTLQGVEVPVNVEVEPDLRIKGKIDRLEREGDGLLIVDFKTGKTPPAAKAVEEMPQLLAYQLALSRGSFEEGQVRTAEGGGEEVEGAVLVYPKNTSGRMTREQSKQTPETLEAFAQRLPAVLESLRGPLLVARENRLCTSCALASICPVQNPESGVAS
ncbi:ATP-dependent DNA helicase [Corynebacterium pelargi]|uniref:DNA 3'-5' helicase n=1 Tax=Corynebacterium pelargi TaxID=1471400 RepID=A0A410WAD2_9CORY|nr:ATP-dependent DNA helicase [Corynebacterium pelargi]QAU52904.1 DNA helicase IV [Corynebacterium pelargi]GGG76123.1 DNA helicase [Corynebacterium pelargi]